MAVTKSRMEENLARISGSIAAACELRGRRRGDVTIVAVTKAVGTDTIENLLDMGLTDLGENRVQQLIGRADEISGAGAATPRWHMIGHLQRNKVNAVVEVAQMIHSVDSLRLAEEINVRAEGQGKVCDVLLQVNCSRETRKHGVAVGAAMYLGELMCTMKHLRLVGLMTMAPLVDDPEAARPTFVQLRELFEEMRHEKIGGEHFRHLSMGMSQDYAVAVEEGATIVRIGTALYE